MDWQPIYREIKALNWIILMVLASGSYFLLSRPVSLGVVLGGLIVIANFGVLQHTVRSAFTHEGVIYRKSKVLIILKYYFRLLALGVIIYILVTRGLVDPRGLAVGLSTIVISITAFGIGRSRKMWNKEAAS
jgi:hypothetical protein